MKIKDNRHFTLVWHSLVAFKEARDIARLMCKLQMDDKNPFYATLYGAIVGYYARPFASSNDLGRLPDSIIPKNFEQYHRDAIQFRNQVFLHTDANAQSPGKPDINHLRFTLLPNSDAFLIHNIVPTPTAKTFHNFCNLIDLLIEQLKAAIRDYVDCKVPGTILVPGTFVLKLDGDCIDLQLEK